MEGEKLDGFLSRSGATIVSGSWMEIKSEPRAVWMGKGMRGCRCYASPLSLILEPVVFSVKGFTYIH